MRVVRVVGALAAVASASACQSVPDVPTPPPSATPSLGELVFRIARSNVRDAAQCGPEYVDAIDPHHADFVAQFDYTVTRDIQNHVPQLLGGTLVPLIQDGRLPLLVHRIADAFGLLVDDGFDPHRETLAAFANIANARTLLEPELPLAVASAALADPAIKDRVHTLALLAQEQDSVTYVLDDLLGVLAAGVDPGASSCSGFHVDVQHSILRTDGFVDDPRYTLGAPAWMVRPDIHGNPAVLVDATTGTLAAPFVDHDGDGAADVDAGGHPVDASGARIDLSWLRGTIPGITRDAQGRALNAHGGLLFDYYDAKRTALSFTIQLGADLVDAGIQHDLYPIAHAILGEPAICNDGTTTCRAYPSADHPLADATYELFELAKVPGAAKLVGVVQRLLDDDPAKGEQLLVALADVVNALRASTLSITDPQLIDTVLGLVPLIDQVFSTANTTGQSTPRLLADLIHDLGAQREEIPRELGYVIQYQKLTKPSGATVPTGTLAVDYARTRFYKNGSSWVDNRSALELMVELMAYADCGYIGAGNGALSINNLAFVALKALFGNIAEGTVSQVLIDAMSRQTPSTVSSLIGFINALNNLGGVEPVVRLIGCSAHDANATAVHFGSLQTLATSGGLDWLLPIAHVFQQQGQLRTIIDIFKHLAADLWLDGTYDAPIAASASAIRKLESPLLSMIVAGAVGKLLDAIDLLYGIQVAGTSDNAAYLAIDVAQHAVATGPTTTRTGAVVASSSIAAELLKAGKTMATRLRAAGADQNLSHAMGLVLDRITNTTTRPDNSRAMSNPNLRVLAVAWLQVARDAADLSDAQYQCYLDAGEHNAVDALTGRNFATLVRVFAQLDVSPNASALTAWVVGMLRGKPADPTTEVYGPLLQLLAAAAASDVSSHDLGKVAHWASAVAARNTTSARGIVSTFDDLLTSDHDDVTLQLARNAVGPGPIASQEAPALTFGRTFADVARIDRATQCTADPVVTPGRLETAVRAAADFFGDDINGISSIWRLIGAIAPPQGP